MSLLSKMIVKSKTTEAEFPGIKGFKVRLAYLTRDELVKLRKKATHNKVNRSTRQVEEEVDSDLFQSLYVAAVVKGWTGLKFSHLPKLLPVDLDPKQDLEMEVPYSEEDAEELMKNAPEFDAFVSSIVGDVENFTQSS
jgi:hypothetical protein